MGRRGPAPTAPCGTAAAYRRHLRHGEPPCDACIWAERERTTDDTGTRTADHRPVLNGLPFKPYIYPGGRFMARLAADPKAWSLS